MHRLHHLRSVLSANSAPTRIHFLACRASSSKGNSDGDKKNLVRIGNAEREVHKARDPQLVPIGYIHPSPNQTVLQHLKWMLQKDNLGQDIFLIGPPGSLRRSLTMMYLEMTNREFEYVALSRDTTENDLKQRREIVSGSALYMDQSAVRAALEGRVLVLEGIEKAERNVLPVLNNLLENREMQLEDGRFLVAADRFDQLLQEHSIGELERWRLVRCDPEFRVIALGLPVPRYTGNSLDPPLRSRFQARDVGSSASYQEILETLNSRYSNVDSTRLMHILSFAHAVGATEEEALGRGLASGIQLPDFPMDRLPVGLDILNQHPDMSNQTLIDRLYPYQAQLKEEGAEAVNELMNQFELLKPDADSSAQLRIRSLDRVEAPAETEREFGTVFNATLDAGESPVELRVYGGTRPPTSDPSFLETTYVEDQLAHMLLSHWSGADLCLVGPRGCGKSALVSAFARRLHYRTESLLLHAEMTARDLLQQRSTLPNGDTVWRLSPLVNAALDGSLLVLDGLHRLNAATFSVLHRLLVDREADLFDGRRLLRADRFEVLRRRTGWSEEELVSRGVLRIHPGFRVVALTEPGQDGAQWLSPDALTSFLFHQLRPMSAAEERAVIAHAIDAPDGQLPGELETLLELVQRLRRTGDASETDTVLGPLATHLSTRQLLRIARRMWRFPESSGGVGEAVRKACLHRFLPRLTQRALDEALEEAGLSAQKEESGKAMVCEQRPGELQIGSVTFPLAEEARNAVKIPDIRFYDNAEQLGLMERLLQDLMLGEHLLLVGNQGVGKNKVVDRLLHLMRRPREYMQLHRDTTVHSLTLQPSLRQGAIVYDDSPLVTAARLGHLLIIDEADKAPTQVTAILKTLVETGEMYLSDGRRIVPAGSQEESEKVLVAHPDFRMIVLANRPGFPFLGNDFFAALGDLFSCHSVDNPPFDSEVQMLRRYGPDVSEERLLQLVRLFSELRAMADEGTLTYPYSTRELVSVVRHLQAFPNEGLASVVRNVFDFDAYSRETKDTLVEVLHRHGVPIGANPNNVRLTKPLPLPPFTLADEWSVAPLRSHAAGATMQLSSEVRPVSVRGPVPLERWEEALERRQARSTHFSEEAASVRLKVDEYSAIGDVCLSQQRLHLLLLNPVALYSIGLRPGGVEQSASALSLADVYPPISASFRPRFRMAAVGPGPEEHLLLHEEVTNILLQVDVRSGNVWRLEGGDDSAMPEKKMRRTASLWPRSGEDQHLDAFKMCSAWSESSEQPLVVFYQQRGSEVRVFQAAESVHCLSLPFSVVALHILSPTRWLVEATDGSKFLLSRPNFEADVYHLQPVESSHAREPFLHCLHQDMPGLTAAEGKPARAALRLDSHLDLIVGDTDSTMRVLTAPLTQSASGKRSNQQHLVPVRHAHAFLPEDGIVARAVGEERVPEGARVKDVVNYLEVVQPGPATVSFLPVTRRSAALPQSSWLRSACPELFVRPTPDGDIITVDHSGAIRCFQVAPTRIDDALKAWRQMLGAEEGPDARNLMIERQLSEDFLSKLQDIDPKMGKIDMDGMPHMGGSTWAGGSGGMGTAGLGGVGGPFRLDGGHDVHQVSDEVKQAVPEHVRAAARDVAMKMWRQRLKEIQMSEYDGEVYANYLNKVQKQVTSLRMVLDTLQAKGKERQWLKNKTEGELDDNKLIEGLIGEKSVYKRRGEKDPEPGTPQQKPKLLRVVADVSGSMYRFNGHDGRLERQLESILMLMEAFQGYEARLNYEVYGHSGEGPMWPFVRSDKVPANNKERLDTLMSLLAHAQFCASGDHTLEAVKEGIKSLKTMEEVDERFLIILSDANLDRYGINPKSLARLLTSEPKVNCYAIFVGTLGNQAQWLSKNLPAGHSFVCLDNKQLPQIMQQIFSSTILST